MGRFDSRGGRDSGRSYGGGRDSGRSYGGGRGRDSGRSQVEMTKVICSACKEECEIPFKPRTDKPVFCSDCFTKNNDKGRSSGGRSSNNGPSSKDIDQINEKLNKIIKALNIED